MKLWILGADDPEMSAIETLLRQHGQTVQYAVQPDGNRVSGGTAYSAAGAIHVSVSGPCGECADCYRGEPQACLGPPLRIDGGPHTAIVVECAIEGQTPSYIVDHHRPGDPGYGKPPAEYWSASSIGQVAALVDGNHGHDILTGSGARDLLMVAAADHCLAAAYAGQCHGVDPAALAEWRTDQIARFKKVERAEVLRRVAETRALLENAPAWVDVRAGLPRSPGSAYSPAQRRWTLNTDEEYWASSSIRWIEPWRDVADLRTIPTDDGQILAEAGCQAGIAYLATVTERDGRRKVVMGGAGEGCVPGRAPIEAFLGGWAAAQGLTDLYPGDATRGFAGGYLPADS